MRKILFYTLFFCYITNIKASNPGYLGISIHNYENASLVGVLVVNVFDESAAKQYGLKENDIISSINGKKLLKTEDLVNELENYNWGDLVILDYIRNGKSNTMKIYLGYKGTERTYNITKSIKKDGEHWWFKDDQTEIILREDNTPVSISKTDSTGKTDTWIPGTEYKEQEVPQYFLDINDKVAGIKRIKDDQAKRNCKINEIVYIKEAKAPKKEQIQVPSTELKLDVFSVFPNPTSGPFTVKIIAEENGNTQLTIFDIVGRVVQTEMIQDFSGEITKEFNLKNQPKGEYLIQLKIGEKQVSKRIFLH